MGCLSHKEVPCSWVGCSLFDPPLDQWAPTVVSAGAQDLLFRLGQKNKQAFYVAMTIATRIGGRRVWGDCIYRAAYQIWIKSPLDKTPGWPGIRERSYVIPITALFLEHHLPNHSCNQVGSLFAITAGSCLSEAET